MLTFSAERAKVWGINIKNRTNNKGGYIHRFRKSQLTIPDPPPQTGGFLFCLSVLPKSYHYSSIWQCAYATLVRVGWGLEMVRDGGGLGLWTPKLTKSEERKQDWLTAAVNGQRVKFEVNICSFVTQGLVGVGGCGNKIDKGRRRKENK